jgi:predicted porin
MQKKLIAVAVAGLMSGAAFAQSNVTISGVADAYYGRINNDGYETTNAINSGGLSGSRIKFSGAEDLGNGMKAIFELEQGVDLTDNGGWNGTRQSYVGLAGSFGAVVLGRLQTPGYYVGKFDALASAAISPQAILSNGAMLGNGAAGVGSTIAPSNNGRLNSAAAYLSPNFGGFSAVLAASTSNYRSEQQILETDAVTEDEGAYAVGLNYAAGPVAVGFVYHNVQNYAGLADGDAKEMMLGASFNAGFLTVLGSYQTAKLELAPLDDKNKLYQIGVVVPVGAGNIHAAYGKLDMDNDDYDAKSYTIAYTHALSKRTTAYVGYNATDNEGTSTAGQSLGVGRTFAGTSTGVSALGGYAVEMGGKATALVVGMRHTF